jgi:hypothetical protein
MCLRKTMLPVLLTVSTLCSSQVPQRFNYQAVVRDAQNAVIANQDVGFRLSILEGSAAGSTVYQETHSVTTNGVGLADLQVGDGSVVSGEFSTIPWGEHSYFLKVEADVAGGTSYEHLGTSQLISVPYSLYSANVSSPTRKFVIQEDQGHPPDSALFEVRNADGQTVFAVYPEGTRVYVLDEGAKARKRGFAVGGYSRTKGITQEYLHVSPDSVRIYVDEEQTKGAKGGFAVGGYSRTKAISDRYFELTPDSAMFTLVSPTEDVTSNALTVVSKSKYWKPGEENGMNLFNLTKENYFIGHHAGESITDGVRNCFLGYEAGFSNSSGNGNIFIGEGSGKNNTEGSYNSYIGFNAGMGNLTGYNNVSLGYRAGLSNQEGINNVFIGTNAGVLSQGGGNVFLGHSAGDQNKFGDSNIMIGFGAGWYADTVQLSVFIGTSAGMHTNNAGNDVFIGYDAGSQNIMGSNNVFMGYSSGYNNVNGSRNTFIGEMSGYKNINGTDNLFLGVDAGYHHTEGNENIFIGNSAGAMHGSGNNNVFVGTLAGFNNMEGQDNIFIGHGAGTDETGSGKLYIDYLNRPADQALIYGELYNNKVRINNQLGIGRIPTVNALEVNGDVSKSAAGEWLVNSDVRIKEKISEIENATEIISRLRPVRFHYTDEWLRMNPGVKDRLYYNFVAQEFRDVFPESVQAGGGLLEGDPEPLLQLDSQPAEIVAIKAIQELIGQNREQQQLIEELQEKVRILEERVGEQ